MVDLPGGAEAHARLRQYDYKENSSLVSTTDSRRDTHEPTGEPESLHGKINPKNFGDRAYVGKPPEVDENARKRKKEQSEPSILEPRKRRRAHEVLFAIDEGGVYQPKTKETTAAYMCMLSIIQNKLGGQPMNLVSGVADEILSVLKDEIHENREKKIVIDLLLGDIITPTEFDQLVNLGKHITDYRDGDVTNHDEDDVGVAVQFGDQEEESDVDMVHDYDDEEEEEDDGRMQIGGGIYEKDGSNEEGMMTVSVNEIGAYWLQKKIYEADHEQKFDAQQRQKLAEDILEILGGDSDQSEVENKLMYHLEYQHFALVKFLLQNRLKIVWCTRLARAENDFEKRKIKDEMMGFKLKEMDAILEQLHASRVTAEERQKISAKSIRDEARRLKIRDDDDFSGGQRQVLDLERISFDQGGLLVANKKCVLPEGSYRNQHKGYEEVHVPALTPRPFASDEKLIEVSSMPDWAQPAFEDMKQLNRVQSKVYETALFKAENILLCAPTGAGKTNVAMLAILQQIGLNRNTDCTFNNNNYKIVYIAPMKALVAEIVGNLSARLHHYGVTVNELSGDQTLTKQQIEETQIIVTTPEKWDIVTRKSGDRTYTQLVKLVIIDEIHLLHDNRGPVLESIVARTLRQIETTKEHIRLVGLSATLPNYKDVALFLRLDLSKKENGLFYFDNSYRPCPLSQQYIGITAKKPLQRFQLMNDICYEKVIGIAGKHQILIFVHSRKETSKTARSIRDSAIANDTLSRFLKDDSASREILQSHTELVKNTDLKNLLPYGISVHHAGMVRSDRQIVESLFADGHIQVLVSTATLAWGVNLPAHTVIIKGTQIYSPEKGAWTELSLLDVMQMLGRAGRPQYDSYGEGIIITEHSQLQYYLSLMNQQLPIESQFVSKLADQLNAEIVLGTVQNTNEASNWLCYTYLYIRMLRNPTLYGLDADVLAKDSTLEEHRADLVHSAATILDKSNLIKYDKKSGYFQVTDLGRIASYYYITHETISTYNEHLKPTMADIDLCRLFSMSEEFKFVTVRQDEKMELAKLLDRVPIPVKESLEEPSVKINVLLQAHISQLKLEGFSLISDMVYITQNAGRLMRALFEIVLKKGWAQLAEKALNFCKMVEKRMWSVQTPLRQFNKMPNEILMKLEKKDLTWERYFDLSSQELGELIRFPKIGKTLHKFIHQFPKLNLSAQIQPITRTLLKVELTITPDFQWDDKIHGYVEPFWVMVEDNDGEHILHHEYFILKKQYINEDHTLNFIVPISEPIPRQYFIRVVSDRWLGSASVLPVSFKNLILPEKFSPPMELLDLQPLPVKALRNPTYEALYKDLKHFNPVQTQVFNVLYNTNDNALVSAPNGSGKKICAEFAILKNHHEKQMNKRVMHAVYVAPVEALAKERFDDWKQKFGDGIGLKVVELTGDTATDLKLVDKSDLIITTPDKWDALSRRWKQRKQIQQVSLFMVDELQLIGSQLGPTLEVIISRMRYIGGDVRIVALCICVANAKDLGQWIGAGSRGIFNFSPDVRPVPLEIQIQGFDISNFEAKMEVMIKPTYTVIAKNGKPAIVFVPTRKHVRFTAVNLTEHADKGRFLLGDVDPLFISRVNELTLSETLKSGVGYLHEGLTISDQDIVRTLFETGRIQICVITSSMCWGPCIRGAHLTVVMGTQFSDGTDYNITDLLQMMSSESCGKCVIFCSDSRIEYYKKFLYEAVPVESHLHQFLHDNLNAEVANGVITSKQDSVDYITWTFMYRRLTQNPNYYNLHGTYQRHLSDYLSELVENIFADLEASKCVTIDEEDNALFSSNFGMIASYYYISCKTIELFSTSLTAKTKLRGLLEILTSASEYEHLRVRADEEDSIRRLMNHQRFTFDSSVNVKANVLLQVHFSRQNLSGNLVVDQKQVVSIASKLIHAMVDVLSSNGCLSRTLVMMEISQMVTQGMWDRDSVFLQVPHFTKDLAKKCEKKIDTVFDLIEMEDAARNELLQILSDSEISDIARFCKNFPNIELTYDVPKEVIAGENISMKVNLSDAGHTSDDTRLSKAGWWIVMGDVEKNKLVCIKRVFSQLIKKSTVVKIDFEAPSEAGKKSYTIFFMSDSYIGCDQEYQFIVDIKTPQE